MRKRNLILLLLLAIVDTLAAQTINLELRNATLDDAFKKIEQQSPYRFVYTKEEMPGARPVTISLRNASLEQVLFQCFKGQPLEYSINDVFVVVKQKAVANSPSIQATISLTGVVLSETGEAIPKATVSIRGENIAVATDNEGRFTLDNVSPTASIHVSSVGFQSRIIALNGRSTLNVILAIEVNSLDETLVIAYGTTSKRLNTGSVGKVSSKEISRQPVSNPLAALHGRIPGLQIVQTTGAPGGAITVQIRGQNSISSGNEPLYIVDGIPYPTKPLGSDFSYTSINYGSPLSSLDPASIESIEVLRDADATSIYGSRGANGVILITTKKGKTGKTKLEASFQTGISQVPHFMKMLSTPEYLSMRKEAFANDKESLTITNAPDLLVWDSTRQTNWQKDLLGGTARNTDTRILVSGGNEQTQFLIGGSYHKESTVFPGDFSYGKYSGQYNLTHNGSNQKLSILLSGSFNNEANDLPYFSMSNLALQTPPNGPVAYDANGNLNFQNNFNNPYQHLQRHYKSITKNFLSNLNVSYQLSPTLLLRTTFGYHQLDFEEKRFSPKSSLNPAILSLRPLAQFASRDQQTLIAEPQIEYKKKWPSLSLQLLAGSTIQTGKTKGLALLAQGFTSDAQLENIAAASSIIVTDPVAIDYRYLAFFGRATIDLQRKYIFNLTGRRDGSSRFGPGRQFANFGAAGAAWIFTSEKFAKRLSPLISFGKLRASYGTTGNDQITDYQYMDTWTTSSYAYQGISGLQPSRLANPDYSWEQNKKFEAGIELGFVTNRIQVNVNYYNNRSSSQLVGYPLPAITGFTSIQSNLPAVIRNSGWEVELKSRILQQSNFNWTSSVNFTIPRNELVSFPFLARTSYANSYVVGEPLGIRKVFKYLGIDPAKGVYQFEDVDKNGSVTSPIDRQTVKPFRQYWYGGWQHSLRYKSVELDLFVQFVRQTGNSYMAAFGVPGSLSNQPSVVNSRWQKPGDLANVQQYTQSTSNPAYAAYTNNVYYGDYIVNSSFARLKNISLTYYASSKWLRPLHLEQLKIFLLAQNIFTVTSYEGLDPELKDPAFLPNMRTIQAGILLTL